MQWFDVFKFSESKIFAINAYYEPFNGLELNDEEDKAKVKRKDLDKYDLIYGSYGNQYEYYSLYIKPFLMANGFKLDLPLDFKQLRHYRYLPDYLFERFNPSLLDDLGIEKSAWSDKERYQQVMKQVANHIFGNVIANIDELVEQLGLELFEDNVQRAIKTRIGELSENGEDPAIMKRQNMLDKAKALAKPNKKGVLMVALKADGYRNVLYRNKNSLKEVTKAYEWNSSQSAWYVDLDSLPALMDTSWFDFDEISVHEPEKYA